MPPWMSVIRVAHLKFRASQDLNRPQIAHLFILRPFAIRAMVRMLFPRTLDVVHYIVVRDVGGVPQRDFGAVSFLTFRALRPFMVDHLRTSLRGQSWDIPIA